MGFRSETVLDDRKRPVMVDCLGNAAIGYPVVLLLVVFSGCLITAVFPHAITAGVTLMAFVLLFTSPVMLAAWRSGTASRQVSRSLLRRECPSCRYELAGARPAPDGCTVCPECGAAWRLHA